MELTYVLAQNMDMYYVLLLLCDKCVCKLCKLSTAGEC